MFRGLSVVDQLRKVRRMYKSLAIVSVIAGLSLITPGAQASGPVLAFVQSGSQGGGYGGSQTLPPSEPRDPAVEAHNRGRSLVAKKITCKKCAYPRGVKNVETASAVAKQVRAGEFELTNEERELVLLYLYNRFGV